MAEIEFVLNCDGLHQEDESLGIDAESRPVTRLGEVRSAGS
jgi:hypothetical protein